MSRRPQLSAINRAAATEVAAYVRVSTEGQEEGTGLDVQRNAIVAYAAANGLTVAAWHQAPRAARERAGAAWTR